MCSEGIAGYCNNNNYAVWRRPFQEPRDLSQSDRVHVGGPAVFRPGRLPHARAGGKRNVRATAVRCRGRFRLL